MFNQSSPLYHSPKTNGDEPLEDDYVSTDDEADNSPGTPASIQNADVTPPIRAPGVQNNNATPRIAAAATRTVAATATKIITAAVEHITTETQTTDEFNGEATDPYEYIVENPFINRGEHDEDGQLAVPVNMGAWWFVKTRPMPTSRQHLNELGTFIFDIQQACATCGLGMVALKQKTCDREDRQKLEELVKSAKEENVQLLIIASDLEDDTYHASIKALEQKHDIPTLHVSYSLVTGINEREIGLQDMAKNIVRKANLKLGGLNYFVMENDEKFIGGGDLLIGVNINFFDIPPEMLANVNSLSIEKTIAVVGYASNDRDQPNAFTGDYMYRSKRPQDIVLALKSILYECIDRFRASRMTDPRSVKFIITVRNCVKRYGIRFNELRQICDSVKQDAAYGNPIYVLTFNKDRDFKPSGLDKPVPGTVRATYLTQSDGLGFDLITHWAPVKGGGGLYEARSAHVEVFSSRGGGKSSGPIEDSNINDPPAPAAPMGGFGGGASLKMETASVAGDAPRGNRLRTNEDDLRLPGDAATEEERKDADVYYWPRLIFALCHAHQLVSYPTSLPVPVRVAVELSKRGHMILGHNLTAETLMGVESEVLQRLGQWTYKNNKLRDQRFNA